jgi:hypothetical protein
MLASLLTADVLPETAVPEKHDELAPLQPIELHSMPTSRERLTISNWRGSVGGMEAILQAISRLPRQAE